MRNGRWLAFSLLAAGAIGAPVPLVVMADVAISPRVVREGYPDVYSALAWVNHPSLKSLDDQDFARALFDRLTDESTGLRLAAISPRAGRDPVADFDAVRNPLILWHQYGFAAERELASTFVTLWQVSGRGEARLAVFPESKRYVAEVESRGRWWAFDVAQSAVFPSDDGFASVEELRTSEERWKQDRGRHFYPQADPAEQRRLLTAGPVTHQYFPATSLFDASYVLRSGSTFTRYFQPQGKRLLIPAALQKNQAYLKQLVAAEEAKPKDASALLYPANGCLIYRPSLTVAEGTPNAAWADGQVAQANIVRSPTGLTLAKAGTGSAVLEIRTPYPIVPEVGKLEDPKDDRNAAVVEIDADGATLSCSLDNGTTWLGLAMKDTPARLDLTAQVAGHSGYLLRIELKGAPDKAIVRSLAITTWVQLAPRSLPQVHTGTNRFTLATGDEQGRPVRSFSVPIWSSDENAFLAPVIRPPRSFQPDSATKRVEGRFTLRMSPPLGCAFGGFAIGGQFACDTQNPTATLMELGYSLTGPGSFAALPTPSVPADHNGADVRWARRVEFPEPRTAAFARCEGRPALNGLQLTTYGVDTTPLTTGSWTITHRWRENAEPKEHRVEVGSEQRAYEFSAGPDVVNESIEFCVP